MAAPAYIVDGDLTDGEAWVALASTEVTGATAANVTLTSPDDGSSTDWSQFMDLVLICYAQLYGASYSANNAAFGCKINSGSSASTANQTLMGDGSSASANLETFTDGRFRWTDGAADGTLDTEVFSASVVQFFDINSGKYKSVLAQSASDFDGAGSVTLNGITWQSQDPIKSLYLYSWSGGISGWSVGTRFDLFGVLPRMVA